MSSFVVKYDIKNVSIVSLLTFKGNVRASLDVTVLMYQK